jgi:hypothetical protein
VNVTLSIVFAQPISRFLLVVGLDSASASAPT